jgi:hypothetical protein
MANQNLKITAAQAGLSDKEKSQIDGLSKLLESHQKLMAMPSNQASQAYSSKPDSEKNAHVGLFGGENPLGNALHYLGSAVKTTLAAPFKALNEVSDFTTRLYRTGAIALDEGINLGDAFKAANDKGDKVFNKSRIAEAERKFGTDIMNVATKVASGETLDKIMAEGTDAEKLIASQAAQLKEEGKNDLLLQDAINAAQAAKYSPGRQLANLLLPESMEGGSLLYKGISGVADAAFRFRTDPFLVLGKAKKAYDAGDWLFYNIVGKDKFSYGRSAVGTINNDARVDRVFANPKVSDFFNVYGQDLDKLAQARKANNPKAMVEASDNLKRLAPEFGPSAIDEFIRAGVKDAATASNYLKNVQDTTFILRGQAGRKTALIPQLDAARKARINFLTTADKVLDINKVGRVLVDNVYGLNVNTENVIQGLTNRAEEIGKAEKAIKKFKQDGSFRFTNTQISARIDRFAQKFAITPYFKNNFFDVNQTDAAGKVYQLARLGNTRYHSRIISEAFAAGDEGQKKQIFDGLWDTVAEIRGWNKSPAGIKILSEGKGRVEQYAPTLFREVTDEAGNVRREPYNPAEFGGEQLAVLDWQLSSGMRVPSILELDSLVAKDALTARMFGPNYKQWADKVTSWWVFGTLAGPRFIIRNSAEDLLVHALVGESQLGIISSRKFIRRLAVADPKTKSSFVARLVDKADRKVAETAMAKAIANNDEIAVQSVMANAIIKDLLGGRIDDAAAARLSEHFKFADKDGLFEAVSEGAKNSLRGASQYTSVTQDVSKFGGVKMAAIEMDGVKYKQATGTSFGNFNPVVSQENRTSWLFTITANTNSELGALAIKNLDPSITREAAIRNIRNYLDGLPKKDLGRFRLYAKGETTQRHAESIYDSVRPYFSKRNGDLNTDLLNKVRFTDEAGNIVVKSDDLSITDIPGLNQIDLAPEFISGPTLVPVTDNFAGGIMQWGWDTMGAANARLTRQPLAIEALNGILKSMDESGFAKSYIQKATAGLKDEAFEAAEKTAKKQLAAIADDLAANKVLAYVDNPEVRSQMSVSIRNFARFYRATEDFYRRVVRSVRYNPESLARASLTYEGITHSGWVQTDENGDQYFFYPGLSPVYRVMEKLGPVFGYGDAFKTGMPVQFGAKLKMITPSMNPDSLFPTFAGPLAALPIKMVGNIVPQVKDLEQYLTGSYGVDQPLINAVLPAHVNRALAALQKDERSSQYASAMRKAATYLEASGQGIKPKIDPDTGEEIPPSPGEIAEFQNKLQASSMTILLLRFAFGFIAPASPSVNLKSDMADWVRDNGQVSYKAVFNKMIEAYNGDIDKAVGEWIKYYPDQMPYTVSESEPTIVANVRAVESATDWVDQNAELLKKYPEAAAFLIPQAGKFDFNAYKLLFKSGLKTSKTVSDFVRQVSTAKDREEYYQKKDEFDEMLASAPSTDAKRLIRNDWETWSTEFKGVRPLLQEELGKGAAKAVDRTRALQDMNLMLSDPSVKAEPKTRKVLKEMLDEYNSYLSARDYAEMPNSGLGSNYAETLRLSTLDTLKSIASENPSALAAYNSLFAPLFR